MPFSMCYLALGLWFANVIFHPSFTSAYQTSDYLKSDKLRTSKDLTRNSKDYRNTIEAYEDYLTTIKGLNVLLRALYRKGYAELRNYENDVLPKYVDQSYRGRGKHYPRKMNDMDLKHHRVDWDSVIRKAKESGRQTVTGGRRATFHHPRRSVRILSKILLSFLKSIRNQGAYGGINTATETTPQTHADKERNDASDDTETGGTLGNANGNTGAPDEDSTRPDINNAETTAITPEISKEKLEEFSAEDTPSGFISTRGGASDLKQPDIRKSMYRSANTDSSGGTYLTPQIYQGFFTGIIPNENYQQQHQYDSNEDWDSEPVNLPSRTTEDHGPSEFVEPVYTGTEYNGFNNFDLST